MSERPARVRVTAPRAARRVPRPELPGAQERPLDDVDVLLLRALVRAQLGLALRVGATAAVLLGGLPLLFAAVPASRDAVVLGLPLPWLLLGVLVFPGLVLVAWGYVRAAERHERELLELVGRR